MLRLRNLPHKCSTCLKLLPTQTNQSHYLQQNINQPTSSIHTSPANHSSIKNLPEYGLHSEPSWDESIISWFVESKFVQTTENLLVQVHDFSGLPWWATIVLSTFAMRLMITVPLQCYSLKQQAKVVPFNQACQVMQMRLAEEIKKEAEINNWDVRTRRRQFVLNTMRHRKELQDKLNPPPIWKRYVVPWAQIPLWVGMSFALRDMSLSIMKNTEITSKMIEIHSQLSQEGLFWSQNLSHSDPYFALPLLTCASNLFVINMYGLKQRSKPLYYFLTSLSVLMVPVACKMPASVVLYWFTSSLFGVFQSSALKTDGVRKFLDVGKYQIVPGPPPPVKKSPE